MRDLKLVIIVATTLLLAGSCNKQATSQAPAVSSSPAEVNPPQPSPDPLATARQTYGQVCARCHKENGEGGRFDMDNIHLKVPSLREGHVLTHSDDKLVRQITNGGEGMPAFKNKLDSQRINDLVRFIHHDFQGKS